MKLVSFVMGQQPAFGAVVGDRVHVLSGSRWPTLTEALADPALARADLSGTVEVPLEDIRYAPVVPEPGAIFCVGMNYANHVQEMGRPMPEKPAIFMRLARSQVAHGEALILPRNSDKFDFEGELAVVIGKPGRHISEENALDHVAGYACYNDGSVRDFQRHTIQFTAGKNFPGTGAFGPWLVTPDEFGRIEDHGVTTRLNGEVVQHSSFTDLIFGVPSLIAYMSSFSPLRTGDVIITGTPGGVGVARQPPLFMKAGDRVEVEIDGIGVLANTVKAEPGA